MKLSIIPKLMLVGLLVLTAASVWAAKVELVTINNGLGITSSSASRAHLSMGPPLTGRTNEVTGQTWGRFGFWEMLSQTMIVSPVEEDIPVARDHLFRNYPNPFNPSTRISFTLAKEGRVRVDVYDLKGRRVDTLLDEVKSAGPHSFTYQPKTLASGAYVILMRSGSFRATQSMMLVK